MKHPGFRGGREVRFAFDATRHRQRNLQRFRAGPHGITPYVELGVMPEAAEARIGPAQDQQTAELGLQTLLGTVGRAHTARVSHSTFPYR